MWDEPTEFYFVEYNLDSNVFSEPVLQMMFEPLEPGFHNLNKLREFLFMAAKLIAEHPEPWRLTIRTESKNEVTP